MARLFTLQQQCPTMMTHQTCDNASRSLLSSFPRPDPGPLPRGDALRGNHGQFHTATFCSTHELPVRQLRYLARLGQASTRCSGIFHRPSGWLGHASTPREGEAAGLCLSWEHQPKRIRRVRCSVPRFEDLLIGAGHEPR